MPPTSPTEISFLLYASLVAGFAVLLLAIELRGR